MVWDELTCPRCGAVADTLAGSVPIDGTERRLRVPVDCSSCATPLVLVVERTTERTPDDRQTEETDEYGQVGVELWLEDRRGEEDEES